MSEENQETSDPIMAAFGLENDKQNDGASTEPKQDTQEPATQEPEQTTDEPKDEYAHLNEDETKEDKESETQDDSKDDYGTEIKKGEERLYTQEELDRISSERTNKAVRERFERMQRNNPEQAQDIQQQAVDYAKDNIEYDPNSSESWQQQLESFVEQTLTKMQQKAMQQQQQQAKQQEEQEFHQKFQQGMARYPDFKDVVGKQPFTDTMTETLKGFDDPTAFAYNAAKHMPKELERISKLQNRHKQMIEIARLDERMRTDANKKTSRTPKPTQKVKQDVPSAHKDTRNSNVTELIAQSEKEQMARFNRR